MEHTTIINGINKSVSSFCDVNCSIALVTGTDSVRFYNYADFLAKLNLPEEYEVIIVDPGCFVIDKEKILQLLKRAVFADGYGLANEQQFFDKAADIAAGGILLLVRDFIQFDTQVFDETIKELKAKGEKVSISSNANFILVDAEYYRSIGGLAGLTRRPVSRRESRGQADTVTPQPKESSPEIREKLIFARDLNGREISLKAGAGTVIDTDVIIDCPEKVKIGANTKIRKGVVLRPEGGEIVIGDNCVINHYTVIHGKGGIYIGDWTIMSPHCGIYAQNHSFDSFDLPITKQPNVGKGVYLMGDNWVGAGAIICDDVTIGKGAVIGANSTVTKSVSMALVAAGSPAKIINRRYPDKWDFSNRERAVPEGMPQDIYEHVMERCRLIKELVNPDDVVLDVGCGEGIVTVEIAKKAKTVVGCDYSIEAVNIAGKLHPEVEFVYSNSTSLRFADNSFTKVVLSDVAEHLMPIQFVNTVGQINRVLKSGCELILATPLTGYGKNTSTYAHIYEYSESEMLRLLSGIFYDVKLINKHYGLIVGKKK
ncbi:MAG: methyltransferase domain-containing protein [Sedimentisphaerales bacterium]|nr:methyltransferase domain-containing protein [Sedimentisphaerales bacterium]